MTKRKKSALKAIKSKYINKHCKNLSETLILTLIHTCREFKKQIDKLDDLDKKLNVWFKYIDWLEQNVPDGGKVNGITNAIEECIEFYHDKRQFKQDERLFRIFMKFKRFCDDPREIFNFMYANSITHLLAQFYLHWSWQYEVCGNMKRALELIKLGIENLASPRETLIEAEKQMNLKIAKMIKRGDYDPEEDISQKPTSSQNQQAAVPDVNIRAALQTLKFKQTKKGSKVSVKRTGAAVDRQNTGGLQGPQMINGVMQVVKPKPVIKTTQKSVPVFKDSLKSSTSIAPLMQKIPTKQKVKALGQTGAENCVIERKALCSRKD